jgi:hypothetical protein
MQGEAEGRLSFGDPAGDGKRERHSHHERERGLNQVVQGTADPLHMLLVMGQEAPETAVGKQSRNFAEVDHFRHHEKHHKPAIGIQRRETLGWGRGGVLHNRFISPKGDLAAIASQLIQESPPGEKTP